MQRFYDGDDGELRGAKPYKRVKSGVENDQDEQDADADDDSASRDVLDDADEPNQ